MQMLASTQQCLQKSMSAVEISMMHLRSLKVTLETTERSIDRSRKLLAPARSMLSRELQVADDYERKLRIAAQLVEQMLAAGFRCELRHGVMLQ
jgi:hypothetical protein